MNSENWIVDFNADNKEYWFPSIQNIHSREEAIEIGMKTATKRKIKAFKIGVIEYANIPTLDGSRILKCMEEQVHNDFSKFSEGYLDYVTSEHKKELAEKVNEIIYQWSNEHKYWPACFNIYKGETITVKNK